GPCRMRDILAVLSAQQGEAYEAGDTIEVGLPLAPDALEVVPLPGRDLEAIHCNEHVLTSHEAPGPVPGAAKVLPRFTTTLPRTEPRPPPHCHQLPPPLRPSRENPSHPRAVAAG